MQPDRAKCQSASFKWVKLNRPNCVRNNIHVTHCSTNTDIEIEIPQEVIKIEDDNNAGAKIEIHFEGACENIVPSTSNVIEDDDYFSPSNAIDNGDYFGEIAANDHDDVIEKSKPLEVKKEDGFSLDEEYATLVPISQKEAKAAIVVYNLCSSGKYRCAQCGRKYHNVNRLAAHVRMHEKVRFFMSFHLVRGPNRI